MSDSPSPSPSPVDPEAPDAGAAASGAAVRAAPADFGPRPFWLRPEIEWPSLLPRATRPGGRGRVRPRADARHCISPGRGPEDCSRTICRRHGTCRPPAPGSRAVLAGSGPPRGLAGLILHLADSCRAERAGAESGAAPDRERLWLEFGAHLRGLVRPDLFDGDEAFEAARPAHETRDGDEAFEAAHPAHETRGGNDDDAFEAARAAHEARHERDASEAENAERRGDAAR